MLASNKIIIIGCGGSGKSTLARALSNKINVPVYHLDKLFWRDNWQMTSKTYQQKVINNVISQDNWVIDGNYGATMTLRIAAADTIVFLDRNRFVCLLNVFKRFIKYKGKSRPDMHDNCPEKIDFDFLKWILTFPEKRRPGIYKMLSASKGSKNIVILKNSQQIRLFLASFH